MQIFSDLSLRERYNTPFSGLDVWVRREMMAMGREPAIEPTYERVPETPAPDKARTYVVDCAHRHIGYTWDNSISIGFLSMEAAEAFMALGPAFFVGEQEGLPVRSLVTKRTISIVEAADNDAMVAKREVLKATRDIQERNEKLRKEYQKELDIETQTRSEIEALWHKSQSRVARYQRIKDVWDEYVILAEGNESAASAFLQKTYGVEEIRLTLEWFSENGEFLNIELPASAPDPSAEAGC